ncbi:MAG: hypothetical protein ABI693_30400, partial [Bryobacteraceae bacterium]
HPEFAAELPAFVAEIGRHFTAGEIREYLDHLERTKFLAPPDHNLEADDLDDEVDEEPWPANPIRYGLARSAQTAVVAEQLLRFCRIQQLFSTSREAAGKNPQSGHGRRFHQVFRQHRYQELRARRTLADPTLRTITPAQDAPEHWRR